MINYARSIMPFQDLGVLKPKIQLFVNNGVKGIFEEANYYSRGAELAELRSYAIVKTLWNPDYNTDKAIDEFVAAYYVPAGKYIHQYITLIHEPVKKNPKAHVCIYSPPSTRYVQPEVISRAAQLFDKAEEAVKQNPTLLHRVQVAPLPIMYVQIVRSGPGHCVVDGDRFVAKNAAKGKKLLDRFVKIARKEGVTAICEWRSFDSWVASMRRKDVPPLLIRLNSGEVRIGVVPQHGGRIWEMTDQVTGKQWMHQGGDAKCGWNPSQGGYEEFSTRGYHAPGYSEAYEIVERGPRHVVLRAKLKNGLALTRKITLAKGTVRAQIETTLRNVGRRTVTASLRTHSEFAADCAHAVLMFMANGERKEWMILEYQGNLFFKDNKRPDGCWALIDRSANAQLVEGFDPANVDTCYVNWDKDESRVKLELCGRQAELAAT